MFIFGHHLWSAIAMWLKWIVVMFVGLVFASGLLGQNQQPNGSHDTVVVAKDRMPVVDLNEIEILSNKRYHSYWKHRRITRLIYNVKKVYPFAKTAGALLRIYDVRLKNAKSDIERKKIMKKAEEDIKRRYTKPLEQLTFTQGFILIKLIDRETGNTSYGLLQKLRGKFTAFFYQAFARLWGYNLKARYDPKGKDKEIETIVKLIDQGKL